LTPQPSQRPALRTLCLAALLALLGPLGCTVQDTGGSLYLFDNASSSVQVWQDVEQLHSAAKEAKAIPEPIRTIKSDTFKRITLAWGGMALDPLNRRLYLVSDTGKVHVILDPANQNGSISGKDKIVSFSLGSSGDRYSGGSVFGQASVDPTHNTLYVVENAKDGESSRLWQVPNASKLDGRTLGKDRHTLGVENDKRCAGVAAGPAHKVYALFGDGDEFTDGPGGANLPGPRLRQGTNGAFPAPLMPRNPVNTLVGDRTLLPDTLGYGALAFDQRHHLLYALVPPAKAGDPPSILTFGEGQFHGHHNQAPERVLPKPPRNLRLIVHPSNSHWMLGAGFTRTGDRGQGAGQGKLYLWKAPSEDGTWIEVPSLPGVTDLRGMASAAD
jgi:hypothetical protein